MQSRYHIHNIRYLAVCGILLLLFTGGCSSGDASKAASSGGGSKSSHADEPLRDPAPKVLAPTASGAVTYGYDTTALDASNVSQGYLMLCYSGANEKVKVQVKAPDGTEYTYLYTAAGAYTVYPLPGGNGVYNISLLESIPGEDTLYAVAFTQDLDVTLEDEFLPFLYPNYYVNFTADSGAVKKGAELAKDCYCDLDVVTNIYNYVIKNVSYDTKKAENVKSGYTPDPDETLSGKKGICFDYASLMSAMLRSQRIPTRLEVGYAGDIYHAWISCYVDEIGWVDDIIEFDGKSWSLMDPTLAASNKRSDVKNYIGDGSKYLVKYTY